MPPSPPGSALLLLLLLLLAAAGRSLPARRVSAGSGLLGAVPARPGALGGSRGGCRSCGSGRASRRSQKFYRRHFLGAPANTRGTSGGAGAGAPGILGAPGVPAGSGRTERGKRLRCCCCCCGGIALEVMLPPAPTGNNTRVCGAVGNPEQSPGGGSEGRLWHGVRGGKQSVICVKSERRRWRKGKGPGKG